jgi:hypothetical protein
MRKEEKRKEKRKENKKKEMPILAHRDLTVYSYTLAIFLHPILHFHF